MARAPIYLDCHATTPVDPAVLEVMLPYFTEAFGNPASASHAWGWKAQEAVERARREVAALLGAQAREVVFTSGATESNNLAIQGAADAAPPERRHLAVSAIEHPSVLAAADRLGAAGWRVSVVPVHADGRLDMDALAAVVDARTALVSVMAANNEIGVLQPLDAIARLAHEAGALLHVDAAQAAAKVPIDVHATGIDLLSVTAHKFYGPKGCGALFVRKGLRLPPILVGGGQERGVRAGTLNVPGIVGLGAASAIGREGLAAEAARVGALRDRLLEGLQSRLDGVTVNGSMAHRLPHNLHVSFAGVDGAQLLVSISDIAVSSGSACCSASATPSHVLAAIMGERAMTDASIRFGLGRFTGVEDVEYAIERFATVVGHLRRVGAVG
ncbi:MAG: cysteine desulfurase family protein [Vicinamibacterales bacterium]